MPSRVESLHWQRPGSRGSSLEGRTSDRRVDAPECGLSERGAHA